MERVAPFLSEDLIPFSIGMSHPLKSTKVHVKTDEEVTEEYHDRLRKRQMNLDSYVNNHKMDEYVERDE